MSRREQIILALMALALVVGGFLYFSDLSRPGGGRPVVSMDEINSLVGNVNVAVTGKGLSPTQKYELQMIDKPWLRDPFLVIDPKSEDGMGEEAQETVAISFEYSAWILAGRRFVGVINGREYQSGDVLAEEGYTLVRIDTKSAFIKGPGESNMIVVPYNDASSKK